MGQACINSLAASEIIVVVDWVAELRSDVCMVDVSGRKKEKYWKEGSENDIS
jgi:hypothetical protein